MTKKTHTLDMLNGPIFSRLCLFALPLALASILQQLFNSADIAVVGRFASSQAMAAVGSTASVISLFVNLATGLAVGANVLIARFIGEERTDKVNTAVHTSLVMSLILGVIILLLGQVFARPILEAIDTPHDVIELAALYLRIYFAGMPFIMVYNFGSAILRAQGDSQRPLYCLIASGIINVILNIIFVMGFHMSSDGVGLATTLSNAVSAAMIIYFLIKEEGMLHFDFRRLSLDKDDVKQIVKIGGPAGLQGTVFSISNVVIQSAINSFGSNAVAGVAAGQNFEFFAYFVVNAFAQASVTFISQNYAAGNKERMKKIYHQSMLASVLMTFTLSMIFIAGRGTFIRFFTTDPKVIHYGLLRMLSITTFEFMTSSYEITGSVLRGMGYSMLPAIETVIGSCIIRLIFIFTIFKLYHNFVFLNMIYPITWIITGTMVIVSYFIISKKVYNV